MTPQFIYEDDDELTHRLVYIGALRWPDDDHKGIRLVGTDTLDRLAEQYGLKRRQLENPEYALLHASYYNPSLFGD